MQVVASDPSAFPQGSIQQLTVHPDPGTPEELCEAEESSVSPHLRQPPTLTVGPVAPAASRLTGRAGSQAILYPQRHGASEIAYLGKHCLKSYFGLFGFTLFFFKSFSHLCGVRGCVSPKVLGSSVAVPVNGLVSRLPAKRGCQDSKIKVKTRRHSGWYEFLQKQT